MKFILLSGGIATGKSAVAEMFRELGVPVLDSDWFAREIVEKGSTVLDEIVNRFGLDILHSDGTLDRGTLAGIIFSDDQARRDLNEITHPPIRERTRAALRELEAEGHELALSEVQLIGPEAGSGGEDQHDALIVVYAPEETQIQRLMDRNGLTRDEALKRIQSQMPIEEKKKLTDYVIDNSGSLADTRKQVQALSKVLAQD